MGNTSSGTAASANTKDALSTLPGSKPRNKKGTKVLASKLKNAERTGVLSLTEHGLKSVPAAVFSLVELRTLDLSVNSLKQLPSLAPLSRLKTLKLQGNKLVALPDLTCLPALLDLNAARNELGLGGDAVPCLPTTLSKLDLSSNKLSQVPAALAAGLPALQICNLSSNAITSLAGLGGLPALEELLADDNQIAVIEPSIRELRRLKTLSLRSNCIGSDLSRGQPLAQELFECTAVVVLNLEGNVITKTQLLDMQGVSKFMERRERSKDKSLAGGALLNFSLCGLD